MKKILVCLLLLPVLGGCGRRSPNAVNDEIESRLKKAMLTNLYEKIHNDSTKIKYEIKDVLFFEDKDYFMCEFKVRLIQKNLDTTGIMTADISKDMTVVKRKS